MSAEQHTDPFLTLAQRRNAASAVARIEAHPATIESAPAAPRCAISPAMTAVINVHMRCDSCRDRNDKPSALIKSP
jgi:hypothetical protein